ncbi:hypothetical protein AQ708_17990 [Burkholderia pseudomallei]|nr:hypothetical protein AQ708_17990 [Burkholderia pseudomallei]
MVLVEPMTIEFLDRSDFHTIEGDLQIKQFLSRIKGILKLRKLVPSESTKSRRRPIALKVVDTDQRSFVGAILSCAMLRLGFEFFNVEIRIIA